MGTLKKGKKNIQLIITDSAKQCGAQVDGSIHGTRQDQRLTACFGLVGQPTILMGSTDTIVWNIPLPCHVASQMPCGLMASYMPCGLQQEKVDVLQNDMSYFQLSSLRIAFCNIPPKIFPLTVSQSSERTQELLKNRLA